MALGSSLWSKLVWVAASSLISWQVSANVEPTSAELSSQRFHYQKAKAALVKNDQGAYQHHFDQLGDYPLKQYLEFRELRSTLANLPFEQIDHFLTAHNESFLASRIRADVLGLLAARGKWSEYLKYDIAETRSTSRQCKHLYAKHKVGDDSALKFVEPLWNHGKSQPKACDDLFKAWEKAGLKTEEIVWSRFHKAMQARNYSLARYLSRQLKERSDLAKTYFEVHRNPKLITKRDRFESHDLATQQIISHGIMRLARTDPMTALYNWEFYEAQQIFPESLGVETKLYILRYLTRKGYSKEAQHLLSYSHSLRDEELLEEIIREGLEELDWARVNDAILMLSKESQETERWQYWRARAQDELGIALENFEKSEVVYNRLRLSRSFYGFLSSDKLSTHYSLADESAPVDAELLSKVAQHHGMRRAQELWLTGASLEARQEWLYTSARMSPEELLAAGDLARQWGWYNTGIQAMISGNFWNQLTVRFPTPYREEIDKISSRTNVDTRLIYAIARQESAFNEAARSPVGAMGLMQLMPQTASFTAKFSGIKHNRTNDLLKPEHNMLLGSHYLNYLLEKYDGNRILAAAAYNAGPHRVTKWLSDAGKERPYDVWIETIPFRETRWYVQNVLCFSVIYGYRLGQPIHFVSETEAKNLL